LASAGASISGAASFKAGAKFRDSTGDNAQAATAGVYVGSLSGNFGVNIADGVNTWGIDLAAGNLRFIRAGVQEAASLRLDGDLRPLASACSTPPRSPPRAPLRRTPRTSPP
jgi:hypothetical protein